MPDREKVIARLEEAMLLSETANECKVTLGYGIVEDVFALLKAQKPHLMTLDEAKSAFVIEYRSGKLKEVGMTILDIDIDPANAYYGVVYRVWTSRPTDEVRRATPWLD